MNDIRAKQILRESLQGELSRKNADLSARLRQRSINKLQQLADSGDAPFTLWQRENRRGSRDLADDVEAYCNELLQYVKAIRECQELLKELGKATINMEEKASI